MPEEPPGRGKSVLVFVKPRDLSECSSDLCQTWKRQIRAHPESSFAWRFKLYGFVCSVLNILLRQDRACEALSFNTYLHWYGKIGGREEGGS